MTTYEGAYLTMVLVAFLAFGTTLYVVAGRNRQL
jgi:hypothetical protein